MVEDGEFEYQLKPAQVSFDDPASTKVLEKEKKMKIERVKKTVQLNKAKKQ